MHLFVTEILDFLATKLMKQKLIIHVSVI